MAKKILITGGNGMVGRNIIEANPNAQYELLAPARSKLNLENYNEVLEFVKASQPEFIIHCAGTVGGIQANIAQPVAFLMDNLRIGTNIILAAREAGIKQLLNVGSSCMYPRNAPNPLSESTILQGELEPTNEGYAIAKIACARLCDYIVREDDSFMYRTIIPCNLYGRHDKFSPLKSHMLPAIIRKIDDAAKNDTQSVEIWGDGTARREFMYAGDLADFIYYALDKFEKLPQYLNVGLGYDYSVNDYYEIASTVLNYNGNFHHDLLKPSGMAQKLIDVSSLHHFGWKAKTSIEDGIAQTYNYYLEEYAND